MPDYPKQQQPTTAKTPTPPQWRPEHWINDDCAVNECIDGFIHYEDHEYETVSRCPRCERAKDRNGHLATGVPTYTGRVTFRSTKELDERREERTRLVQDHTYRRQRAREFFAELSKLPGMFTPPKDVDPF